MSFFPLTQTGRTAGLNVSHLLNITTDFLVALLKAPARWYERRQLGHLMADMSEHELSDIGLMRQDVVDLTALPLSSEIGAFLAERASERRRGL